MTHDTPRGIRRADFLKGAAAIGAAGVVARPALASVAAANTSRQPPQSGWRPKTPRLTTPWTHEVSPSNAHPEYPRPQLTRPHWANLNGVWQFAAATEGEAPPVGRDLSERILVPYPVESALSGIERHEERMFYRRHFVVDAAWRVARGHDAARLLLHLDAVDYEATVYVNGRRVGTHRGGYDRITLDITDALHVDRHGAPCGDQELIVAVYDPTEDGVQPLGKQRNSALAGPDGPNYQTIYYTPASGIWQTVWLEAVPATYVRGLVLTPDLPGRSLRIRTDVCGRGGRVQAAAYDAHGRRVGSASGYCDEQLRLGLDRPHPWTPDDPYLYQLRVRIDGGDEVHSYFGMRSVEVKPVDGVPRIVLNGKATFCLSTLQQGFWPDGIYTPATDAAAEFDVARNKALGFNTIRKHQKVESDRWYYHADRLGQLVWQDMPAVTFRATPPGNNQPPAEPPVDGQREFEGELARMIDGLVNHPSIIMWIPFNEGWGQYDVARIAAAVKRRDPTRIVNEQSGADTAGYDAGGGEVLDLHNIGFSPPAPVPPTSNGRASVIGEFGAYGLAVDAHLWDPGFSTTPARVPDAATLNDRYVTIMQAVEGYAADQHLTGANYNLFEDAEDQVNGLYTYDRQVLKVDADRVRAANLAVIAAGVKAGRQ